MSRISWRSRSGFDRFQLPSHRRAALRERFRKFEAESFPANQDSSSHVPGLSLQIWMPLLLLPLILVFLGMLSVVRVFGSAVRWIVIWCGGFLMGGLSAWGLNALSGAGYSNSVVWAAGGFLGLVVLSSLYGMCLEWVFWLSRHENNLYAGTVSLSPEQETDRVRFAKSLHWPTALASAGGGLLFAFILFPLIAGIQTQWPAILWWGLLGAIGLAVQGFLLGCYLGWKRNRVVFDASQHSLGEYLGWQIAGPHRGFRPALGWGMGYALHQLPAGAIAGLVLGIITQLFLA